LSSLKKVKDVFKVFKTYKKTKTYKTDIKINTLTMKNKKNINLEKELKKIEIELTETSDNLQILIRLLGKDFKDREYLPHISDHLLKLYKIYKSKFEPYSTNAKNIYDSYLTLIKTAHLGTFYALKRELKKPKK